MLFVIEGCDRTGKTSLAQRIADKVEGRVVHAGPPTRHPLEEYETALDGYDPRGEDHLILDRWNLGEHVWPRIFERETKYTRACEIHLAMFMRSRGAFFIWADRDPEKLAHELVEHNEPLVPEKLGEAQRLFEEAFNDVGAFGAWNYERHGDSEVNTFIESAYTYAWSVGQIWETVGPGWVGSEYPEVLLVGDELGPLKEGTSPPDDVPFAPYDATSGRYLMDSVPKWKRYAVVNAFQGRNHQLRNLRFVYESFHTPKVVALGTQADEALKKFNIPHGHVPHPQYWRRFRYNDREEYISKIEEAGCTTVQ